MHDKCCMKDVQGHECTCGPLDEFEALDKDEGNSLNIGLLLEPVWRKHDCTKAFGAISLQHQCNTVMILALDVHTGILQHNIQVVGKLGHVKTHLRAQPLQ